LGRARGVAPFPSAFAGLWATEAAGEQAPFATNHPPFLNARRDTGRWKVERPGRDGGDRRGGGLGRQPGVRARGRSRLPPGSYRVLGRRRTVTRSRVRLSRHQGQQTKSSRWSEPGGPGGCDRAVGVSPRRPPAPPWTASTPGRRIPGPGERFPGSPRSLCWCLGEHRGAHGGEVAPAAFHSRWQMDRQQRHMRQFGSGCRDAARSAGVLTRIGPPPKPVGRSRPMGVPSCPGGGDPTSAPVGSERPARKVKAPWPATPQLLPL